MIKKINGHRLSSKKKVRCCPYPGAKIEGITSKERDLITKHTPSEVVLHVGTNNVTDNAELIVSKLQTAGKVIKKTSPTSSVTISSIIHRPLETQRNHDKVKAVNSELKSLTQTLGWGFICNNNITSAHIAADGVHLNKRGISAFAGNLISHIRGTPHPSETNSTTDHPRTPERLHHADEEVHHPRPRTSETKQGFRKNSFLRTRQKLFPQRPSKQDQNWTQYLKYVAKVTSTQ